jgi:hypothetical protein
MLTVAEHIPNSKAGGEPASFRDRYEEALLAHLKAKQAGHVGGAKASTRCAGGSTAWRRAAAKKPVVAARKGAPARERA